ncbi:uncharacterized protein LOC112052935 [Bicyclus anynana]|uniref:Uncharacterized protein LOC112052935 n=1 Tax=Bicyclus anynana TaxID=110368 RepID=A0ABM3LGG0_BICAN|nr:uncharacterized protein LOC112052935 [Bicyclus anynana]
MERAGRRAKAGSLSGLSGPAGAAPAVRRQRSLEWAGDRYSSSDEDRPQNTQLNDRVFASLLAQATQQFDNEQRRIYGSENGEGPPRYISSPQRQASPFPLESTNRRFYRRNRNSNGEEILSGEAAGTLSRRSRREEFPHEANERANRLCHVNGPSSGAQSERECESPPEPAPPEVPPRGPSLHVTLRHRPAPDQPADADRLFLSEEFVMSEGGHGGSGTYPARSPISSSTTGHSSSSHHRPEFTDFHINGVCRTGPSNIKHSLNKERFFPVHQTLFDSGL